MNTSNFVLPTATALRRLACALLAALVTTLPPLAFAQAPGTVDLLPTPPEITPSVAPNIVLTFDDSGSMAREYMPDDRPHETPFTDWGQGSAISTDPSRPWFCAATIDPRVTDSTDPRSKPMNGMYYSPNVSYKPPLNADAVTEFPEATFTAAWNDGIRHNRPTNAVTTLGTRNLANSSYCRAVMAAADPLYHILAGASFNQDWSDTGLITGNSWAGHPFMTNNRGDITGTLVNRDPRLLLGTYGTPLLNANNINPLVTTGGVFEVQGGVQINGNPTIAFQGDANFDAPTIWLRINTTNCTNVRVRSLLRDINDTSTAAQQVAVQARVGTSGNFTNFDYVANANNNGSTPSDFVLNPSFNNQPRIQIRWMTTDATGNDNMIGVDDIQVTGTCTPLPASSAGYYQLKSDVAVTTDEFGRITNGTATLYTAANWEWVPLPASQQQNFANWYSYYRTRTNSAKTAMSRAFAPFDQNIRVVWQNLHTSQIAGATRIFKFANDATNNANPAVRDAFYNWLFQIPTAGGTPTIAATIRAGEFFRRNTVGAETNPYWDRDLNRELSCRQNFHINMSDGFWKDENVPPPLPRRFTQQAITALPDGRPYNPTDSETSVIHRYGDQYPNPSNVNPRISPLLADVSFHYWATNLRPTFSDQASTRLKVPPFIPDRSISLFGIPEASGANPADNKEIYWNPANDPATWSHMVNFNVSFGLDGFLPNTPQVYRELRLGSSTWKWPMPPSVNGEDPEKLDDFWRGALVSRGRYLSAQNPEQLINALQQIVASIVARRGASTAVSVSLPIITDGTTGYTAGYDTTDWSGFVVRNQLHPESGVRLQTLWDAGCILTGGLCPSTGETNLPVRAPNSRVIVTSEGARGTGKEFSWGNLSATQRARLNTDPSTLNLIINTQTSDGFGEQRVAYIRGSRVNESTASPRFRARSSVLGAVIRGQPVFVSSPASGFSDIYPPLSPEATGSYEVYQNEQRGRRPTIFVAANDGMLHAFDAANGKEAWAFVPNMVIDNYRLTKSTQFESGFTPTVDDKPVVSDAFINGAWKTVLLGSMRLGGRGIYALDVTKAERGDEVTTAAVSSKVLWEFSNVPPSGTSGTDGTDCGAGSRYCSSLGYTYDSVNIARLKHGNKWVALVSSGYFPQNGQDPASLSTAAARTSLLVIDLETGTLIREILTSSASQAATASFGLSQAIVYDRGSDLVDDIAYAGDLAGNMWRFDLQADNPNDWKVDLMFRTYGNGGTALPGEQPISAAPITMTDSAEGRTMLIFGTGKFIGGVDRTAAIPIQSHFGIRDYDTNSPNYPIRVNQLATQSMAQDAFGVRSITSISQIPSSLSPLNPGRGWRIQMNIPSEPGERSLATPFPFYTSNLVLLRSIIPIDVDPCNPGARYGLIVVNATDGTAFVDPNIATPSRVVGGVVASSTPPGDPITLRGGGAVVFAGLRDPNAAGGAVSDAAANAIEAAASNADDIWHRGAWRELLDQM